MEFLFYAVALGNPETASMIPKALCRRRPLFPFIYVRNSVETIHRTIMEAFSPRLALRRAPFRARRTMRSSELSEKLDTKAHVPNLSLPVSLLLAIAPKRPNKIIRKQLRAADKRREQSEERNLGSQIGDVCLRWGGRSG